MIAALLLACATEPSGPWTEARALRPTLTRMDRDGDGHVTAAEYAPVSFGGPPFAQADADADGDLELDELAALDASLDPLAFFASPKLALAEKAAGPRPGTAPAGEGRPGQPKAPSSASELHDVRWILLTLRDEVEEVAPAAELPTREQIEAVGGQELTSEPVQAVLARLERAADQHGVAFPASLRAR